MPGQITWHIMEERKMGFSPCFWRKKKKKKGSCIFILYWNFQIMDLALLANTFLNANQSTASWFYNWHQFTHVNESQPIPGHYAP